MVESSDEPSLFDRIRLKAHASILGPKKAEQPTVLPLRDSNSPSNGSPVRDSEKLDDLRHHGSSSNTTGNNVATETKNSLPPPAPPPAYEDGSAAESATINPDEERQSVFVRFCRTSKEIITYSYINLLLVFVPIGIAAEYAHLNPRIVFALNAIAVIPLAGLLSHATEAVASSLGDTIGALLNVTFGNAVELIIFIIALTKDEIRIVQASIVGSILSNLLLILGMAFVLGGLRFREQIYNSTVTQMSACLLSLSVTSLLLPTAFHASFKDNATADDRVLRLSRASAVILLFIYVLYLLFQLKSHAYMYQSTPQHIIDEESHPGVLANMLNSSSSSSDSSTSDTDSDSSSGSRNTAKKIKKAIMRRARRKSSTSSKEAPSLPSTVRTESFSESPVLISALSDRPDRQLGAIVSGDEADTDGERPTHRSGNRIVGSQARDFESERISRGTGSPACSVRNKKRKHHRRPNKHFKKHSKHHGTEMYPEAIAAEDVHSERPGPRQPQVAFVGEEQEINNRRPLNLRNISRPAMPKLLSQSVFSSANSTGAPGPAGVSVPRAPYGLRRTSSLPDRLNKSRSQSNRPTEHPSVSAYVPPPVAPDSPIQKHMSRTSAVILLVISTALVALCAENLVGGINYMVEHTDVSQAFIGLIILPVVGNAAEHVTAVTVAAKNKMDLAIGVAIGSSIQIALFVTPLVILLGWCMGKEMSLFFSLFETISLFVSAFIINFLILDGRSNYLEGALLIAAYVIIAVGAWFYPTAKEQSPIGGAPDGPDASRMLMARGLTMLTGWQFE